ncbi:MAG: amidohydrolase family protein [Chloroflexi bacterium]|nr:amidohydrolase family protein [Chloroflexota bacterium]
MTPYEIRQLREDLGLSQAQMAAKLGTHYRTVGRWELGLYAPSPLGLAQLEGLRKRTKGNKGMNIDIHAHYVGSAYFDLLDKYGGQLSFEIVTDSHGERALKGRSGAPSPTRPYYDVEHRFGEMKAMDVDMQVVSLMAGPVPNVHLWEPEVGLALSRVNNDAYSELAQRHPQRFVGIAAVPLQNVDMAIAELERIAKLPGIRGVQMCSNIKGKYLDSEDFWPFYQRVQELDLPILVHPASSVLGMERMNSRVEAVILGYPMDTSLTIVRILFSGLLERFPKLRFCFTHGGGVIPYLRGRIEWRYETAPEMKASLPHPPSKYLERMSFCSAIYDDGALSYLIRRQGADRVMMGSDYPASLGVPQPVEQIQRLADVSSQDKKKVLGETAASFFKIL